ncbi:hypothetical protein D3C72_1915490 [compost metagenome]
MSKPVMAWVCQPARWACRAKKPQAAPVSKPCEGAGCASLLPGGTKVVFETITSSAEACCAQPRLNSISRLR